MMSSAIAFPKAVLFDMDGTLTIPAFDFPAVRQQMGIPAGKPILEYLATMPPANRARARRVLHRIEDDIAQSVPLADRCGEIIEYLASRRTKVALITRNRRASVRTFLRRHHLPISVCIAREDGPHKPDPAGLCLASAKLGVEARNCWMVGDGQYDVEAGINAGMFTVWLHHGRDRNFSATPGLTFRDLCELDTYLRSL